MILKNIPRKTSSQGKTRVSFALPIGARVPVWIFLLSLISVGTLAQEPAHQPSVKWEELTAEDFAKAIEKSQGTCLLPFGIVEKHGPHLPLGTDLLNVRYGSLKA